MGTDFSKVRLDALRDYSGVHLKQGAVLLDSDTNELTDIIDRRLRALASDALDRVRVSKTTPDAFLITAPGGTLQIGVGRLYVDGLLAECHGAVTATATDRVFDELLGEPKFANPVPYAAQPYLPQPPTLPTTGDHLVYLDVWNREVTHLEEPDLVETAVGVETTSREQTVWQVLVLPPALDPGDTCATPDADLPDWADLIAPSTGTLTTGTFEVPPAGDPCELPPTGGYRGLEHRLYRVEIHDPGQPGAGATFKWSGFNSSIGTRVTSIVNSGEVEVQSLGRDDILSLKTNDWVEFTDDVREFAQLPGEMRKITVDPATRRITFAALPADMASGPFPDSIGPKARNLRLRRWDQKGKIFAVGATGPVLFQDLDAGTSGLIDVPAAGTTLILENGVTISLASTGAKGFRTGDYWVFAASPVDASVEQLDQAPPLGVHHHYARLGIWHAPTDQVDDCRPPAEAAGCCTMVVRPGDDIQKAINALPPEGGCVCLKVGEHVVTEAVVIDRDNVTLHGESMGAVIVNPKGSGLLAIDDAELTRIHTLVLRQGEAAAQPVIFVVGAQRTIIDDCVVETIAHQRAVGLLAIHATELDVRSTSFARPGTGILLEERCSNVTISGCHFEMPGKELQGANSVAIWAAHMQPALTAENNVITGAVNGILVNDDPRLLPDSLTSNSRVTGNRIELVEARSAAERAFGIDMAAASSIVADNHVAHSGGNVTGIRIAGSDSRADGNVISSRAKDVGLALGIALGHEQEGKFLPLDRITAANNVIDGIQHGIGVVHVDHAQVRSNLLGQTDRPFGLGISLRDSSDCLVAENVMTGALFGIMALSAARCTISGNRVEGGQTGIAVGGVEAAMIAGNRVVAPEQIGIVAMQIMHRCDMVNNHAIHCGWKAETAMGLAGWLVFGEWHVEANEVFDTGLPTQGNGAPVAHGITGLHVLEARIESNRVGYSDIFFGVTKRNVAGEDRALRLQGWYERAIINSRVVFGGAVQIADNKFEGCGRTALVELLETNVTPPNQDQVIDFIRFERVLVSGNYCWHLADQTAGADAATVSIVGRVCSISSNQVKTWVRGYPSWHLHEVRGPFIGNVSSGATLGRTIAPELPNPESAFNLRA